MHRFAQCTRIWKKFQNSVIHTSRNHNDEIAEVSQSCISYVIKTIQPNYSKIYFLQNWVRILIWIVIDFIKNYRHIIFKTDYQNYVPFKNICVHNLCRFSDTGIIMTPQRRCYARDLQNHAYIFYNAWFASPRFGISLANFGFVMYQNQIIHVIIGFKHAVSCNVRSEALRGHSDTSVHSALLMKLQEYSDIHIPWLMFVKSVLS